MKKIIIALTLIISVTLSACDSTSDPFNELNQYTVEYVDYDGTVLQTADYDFGADLSGVTAPTDPSREGYTFSGWDATVPATMGTTKVTITATYTVNKYTVEYVDYDGKVLQTADYDFGADLSGVTAPTDPSREGYTFSGWDATVPATMGSNNIKIHASYVINTYTVFFKDYDGTILKEVIVDYGLDASPPADPHREGHTFIGWDTPSESVTEDLIVVAQYGLKLYNVTINVINNDVILNNVKIEWSLSMVTSYFGNLWTYTGASSYPPNGVLGNDFAYNRDISNSLNLKDGEYIIDFLNHVSSGAMVRTNYDRVFSWGKDTWGELARGTLGGIINHPIEVTDNLNLNGESILQWKNGILLTSGNRVITWGRNSHGQLGIGSTTYDVPYGNDITKYFDLKENDLITGVFSIDQSKYAISADGYLFAWGDNNYNAVQPDIDFQKIPYITSPSNITSYFDLEENEKILEFAMRNSKYYYFTNHYFIRTNKDRYFVFGLDSIGLGENPDKISNQFYHKTPYDTTKRLNLNPYESIMQIVRTTNGLQGSFIVTNMGRLLHIINHNSSILDITNKFSLKNDEKIIIFDSSWGSHAALTSHGRLFTWGYNSIGQLGDGTVIDRDEPQDITKNILFQTENETIQGISFWSNSLMVVSSENRIYGSGRVEISSNNVLFYRVHHHIELDLEMALDEEIVSIDATNLSLVTNKGNVYILHQNLGNLYSYVEQTTHRKVWDTEKYYGDEINILDILEELIGHNVDILVYSDLGMLNEVEAGNVIINGEMIVYVLIKEIFD